MKLKTRTNQPVYYKLPVSSDIQHMSDDLLNSLRVGDVVQKKTGNQKHCYIVTYKEEKKGICLTYVDGSGYMETISYDYTGGHWVYNSKDVFHGDEIADGDFSGKDLIAKTIKQSEANVSVDLSSLVPETLTAGLVYSAKYCRLEEINGILYFIWNFTLDNPTENNIGISWIYMDMLIPTSIAEKIYDFDNKSVHEASQRDICAFILFSGTSAYPQYLSNSNLCYFRNTNTPDKMTLGVNINQNVNANKTMICSGRIALTTI